MRRNNPIFTGHCERCGAESVCSSLEGKIYSSYNEGWWHKCKCCEHMVVLSPNYPKETPVQEDPTQEPQEQPLVAKRLAGAAISGLILGLMLGGLLFSFVVDKL